MTMKPAALAGDAPAANTRPFWKEPMVWLVWGLPLASVVAGLWLVVTAVRAGGADPVIDDVQRVSQIQTTDLGPDEALRLRDAGTIQSFEKLNAAALAKHPGATIEETELEQEHGRYQYQVELRDSQGKEWDVLLDATNASVLQDQQDH